MPAGDVSDPGGEAPSAGAATPAGDGAAQAAREWVRLVMDDRDLAAAWPRTDPSLRKVLAQHWILQSAPEVVGPPEGWESMADRLAAEPPTHPLWSRFAAERLTRWREFWPGFSAVAWGVRDTTEIRPGVVVVSFVEPRGKLMQLRPGPPLEFRRLAVRRAGDGWLMAGLDGANLFQPGWPPGPA